MQDKNFKKLYSKVAEYILANYIILSERSEKQDEL